MGRLRKRCSPMAVSITFFSSFFFFQAEDGIRDVAVTGVQTCALPIFATHLERLAADGGADAEAAAEVLSLFRGLDALSGYFGTLGRQAPRRSDVERVVDEIGRASCRERVLLSVVALSLQLILHILVLC